MSGPGGGISPPSEPRGERPSRDGPPGERSALTDSAPGRLLGALVAPRATFRSLARRPTWLAPLALLVLINLAVGYLVLERIDYDQLLRQQSERTGQLTAEQIDQQSARLHNMAPYLALAQGLLASPAILLVVGLLFWVGFRLVGSEMTYKESFATCLHALLPGAVGGLISIPVILQHATFTVAESRAGSFLASNLGLLAPEGAGPAVRALLTSMDLFNGWVVVLLAIGFGAVARVSRAATIGVVATLVALAVALRIAVAAITG